MGLMDAIGEGPVGLDTAIFIYFIEEHPRYLSLVEPVFEAIDRGQLAGVTSGLTLLETLVVPLRKGDRELALSYEAVLTRSRGLQMVALDRPVLVAAARLRAAVRLRTPDALQLAAALAGSCTTFLTNDRAFPSDQGITVLQLDAFRS